MTTSRVEFSSNLQLSATPTIDQQKNADLYNEFQDLHNAIRLVQSYLDSYTGANILATASQNIQAGRMINFFTSGGVIKAQLADSTTGAKPCHAFARASVGTGNASEFQTIGVDQIISGLTPGTQYYLGVSGALTSVAPVAAGTLVQVVGVAIAPDLLLFRPSFQWKQN